MELLKRITDKDITGADRICRNEPRRVVRAVLLDENDQVAVLYIGKCNFYILPGGGIEDGEKPEQALRREALEETGCRCEIVRELGIVEENGASRDYFEKSYCYLARVAGEKGALNLTEEETLEDTRLEWHGIYRAADLIKKQECPDYEMKFSVMRDGVLMDEVLRNIIPVPHVGGGAKKI